MRILQQNLRIFHYNYLEIIWTPPPPFFNGSILHTLKHIVYFVLMHTTFRYVLLTKTSQQEGRVSDGNHKGTLVIFVARNAMELRHTEWIYKTREIQS